MNPFRRTTPPHYDQPVNAFEFQVDMAQDLGGWHHLARQLLPAYYRDDDGTWRILGPRWNTRTCTQDQEWCLFMIECAHNEDRPTLPARQWTFEGPSR